MASPDRLPHETVLRARARRAYEWGRVRAGLRRAWPAALLVVVGLGRGPELCLATGAALAVAIVALTWRGRTLGRAVWPGLLAGLPPLVLPMLVGLGGHACRSCAEAPRWPLCVAACVAGGMIAGVLVGLRATREPARAAFVAAAGLLATLTGLFGCTIAGGVGVLGMIAGLVVASAPILALARAARSP